LGVFCLLSSVYLLAMVADWVCSAWYLYLLLMGMCWYLVAGHGSLFGINFIWVSRYICCGLSFAVSFVVGFCINSKGHDGNQFCSSC